MCIVPPVRCPNHQNVSRRTTFPSPFCVGEGGEGSPDRHSGWRVGGEDEGTRASLYHLLWSFGKGARVAGSGEWVREEGNQVRSCCCQDNAFKKGERGSQAMRPLVLLLLPARAFAAVSSKIGKGMLPASMVFLHSCFLCWGALTSNPDVSCNEYANDDDVSRIVIGIIISALMLSWTRWGGGAGTQGSVGDFLLCCELMNVARDFPLPPPLPTNLFLSVLGRLVACVRNVKMTNLPPPLHLP